MNRAIPGNCPAFHAAVHCRMATSRYLAAFGTRGSTMMRNSSLSPSVRQIIHSSGLKPNRSRKSLSPCSPSGIRRNSPITLHVALRWYFMWITSHLSFSQRERRWNGLFIYRRSGFFADFFPKTTECRFRSLVYLLGTAVWVALARASEGESCRRCYRHRFVAWSMIVEPHDLPLNALHFALEKGGAFSRRKNFQKPIKHSLDVCSASSSSFGARCEIPCDPRVGSS